MSEKTYHFGDETITASADLSVDQVRQAWEVVFPSLANAQAVELSDGSIRFETRAGTKG